MKQLSFFSTDQHKPEIQTWTLYIDGASRGNPGPAGAGFMLKTNDTTIKEYYYLGQKTNNQAEYYALLLGLFTFVHYKKDHDSIEIYSDSLLLVKQVQGIYRVKHEGLKQLYACAMHYLSKIGSYKISHIKREKNTIADKLANQGIDHKKALPEAFVSYFSSFCSLP